MDPVWKLRSGEFTGWIEDEYLYNIQGRCIGYIEENIIFSNSGSYLGELYDDEYIGKRLGVKHPKKHVKLGNSKPGRGYRPNRLGRPISGWDDPDI